MRGTLLAGILVIILLIAGLSYYRMVTISSHSRPAYDALPVSTSLFFEFKDFAKTASLLNGASFSKDLTKTGFIVKLKSETAALDSILGATSYTFSNNKAVASVYFTELNQYDYLYLIELKNVVSRDIKIALRKVEDNRKAKVNERDFKGEPIYEVTWPGVQKPVAFAFLKGVLICSFSPFLVEESIMQIREKPSIAKDKGFKDLLKVAGANADATVYLRFAKLDRLQSLLINPDVDSVFPFLKKFSGWMAADFTIKSNSFIINGYTVSGDSSNTYLSQFRQGPVRKMSVADVLPNNTAVYVYHLLGDLIPKENAKEPIEYKYLRPWSDDELAYGIAEPFDSDFRQQYFLAVSITNDEKALASLTELMSLSGEKPVFDDNAGYKIGHLKVGKAVGNFYDAQLFNLVDPYFVVLKTHVVFANSEGTLRNLVNNYVNGQTLAKTSAYQDFTKNLSDKCNVLAYIDPSRSVEIMNALLAPGLLDEVSAGDQSFRKFSPIAMQFTKDGNAFFTTGFVNYQGRTEEHTNQVWRTKLDTTAIVAPCEVTDKQSGDPLVFVQDALYNIYMVNKAGRVLWKKNVGAQVKGKFNSIDLYKDDRQQFVFNTSKEIYVVNMKGNNVENYPIKLPAPATTGMLVVDPDSTRDYKMFVGCNNFAVYGYKISGRPLNGWNPQTRTGTVTMMQYMRYDSADHIIAVNISGNVMIFALDGKKVMDPIKQDKKFNSPFSFYQTDTSFLVVNADPSGVVSTIDKHGNINTIQSDSTAGQYFLFMQKSVGMPNYIFTDSNKVKIYDKQQQKVNEFTLPVAIDRPAFAINIPGIGKGMGLVSADADKVYLYSPDLTLMENFPLEGSTAFDIFLLGKDEQKILVTADKDGYLDAYRLK